jgi:hypothetical protein
MAYQFRFGDPGGQSEVVETLSRSPQVLALAARGALSFDLPAAQAALGTALAGSGSDPSARASGEVARGVALVALGRPAAGQLSFDSAAALFPAPDEARLQAEEWRIIPAALGVAGWSAAARARGRAALQTMTNDSSLRTRAMWALALDAYSRGDTAAARARGQAVTGSERQSGLALMLTGLAHAARGDWEAALAATEPALAFDSAGHAPDPFFRAALHLKRGEWLERLGRTAEANRAWLWYENLDLRAWPDAEVQPAEVDWALASHARSRRARLALERGDRSAGCGLARRVAELWAKAEPEVATLAGEVAGMAQGCPS